MDNNTTTNERENTMKGFFNNNRGFGVELELVRPSRISKQRIIDEINNTTTALADWPRNNLSDRDRRFWKMTTDGSVRTSKRGHAGDNELVSPILRGQNGMQELKEVLEVLNRLNCSVNMTCGTHVHHDVTEIVESSKNAKRFMDNLITWVCKFEHLIYRLVSPSRLTGIYSQPSRLRLTNNGRDLQFNFKKSLKTRVKSWESSKSSTDVQTNRYCGLNLQNVWTRGSVEFRYHNGTLDFDKLQSWIVLTQAIVNVCEKKTHVKMSTIKSGSKGLAQMRKALGLTEPNGCDLTKQSNKYTIKRFRELSRRESEFLNADRSNIVREGL